MIAYIMLKKFNNCKTNIFATVETATDLRLWDKFIYPLSRSLGNYISETFKSL